MTADRQTELNHLADTADALAAAKTANAGRIQLSDPPAPAGGRTNNVRVVHDSHVGRLIDQFTEGHDGHAAETFTELANWWLDQASGEIARTAVKAVEYGAGDLIDVGQTLARCMGRTVSDQEAAELGVYFYVVGKLSRWTDAVKRGDLVGEDTIFDLGVYTRMALRIRASGGWPGKLDRHKDNKE